MEAKALKNLIDAFATRGSFLADSDIAPFCWRKGSSNPLKSGVGGFGLPSATATGVTNLVPLAGLEQLIASLIAGISQTSPIVETASTDVPEFPELFGDLTELDVPKEEKPRGPEKRKDFLVPMQLALVPIPPGLPIAVEPEMGEAAAAFAPTAPGVGIEPDVGEFANVGQRHALPLELSTPLEPAIDSAKSPSIDEQPEAPMKVMRPNEPPRPLLDRPGGLSYEDSLIPTQVGKSSAVGQPSPAAAGLPPGAVRLSAADLWGSFNRHNARVDDPPQAASLPQTKEQFSAVMPFVVNTDSAPAPSVTEAEPVPTTTTAPLAFAARLVPIEPDNEPPAPRKMVDRQPSEPAPTKEPVGRPAPEPLPRVTPSLPIETARDVESDEPQAIPIREPGILPPAAHATVPVTPSHAEPVSKPEAVLRPAPPEPATEAAPPKSPARASDIRFAVADGNRRVELRLSDRAGEVRVAVRTADTRLAAELRDNLPALSSRLEDAGFRAASWQAPAPLHAEAIPSDVRQASGGQPDRRQPDRHDDPDSRQFKHQDEHSNRKKKGKEFEWLMSSLQ